MDSFSIGHIVIRVLSAKRECRGAGKGWAGWKIVHPDFKVIEKKGRNRLLNLVASWSEIISNWVELWI